MAKKVNNKKEPSKQLSFKELKTSVLINDFKKNVLKNFPRFIIILASVCFILLLYVNREDFSFSGFGNWISDSIAVRGRGSGYPVEITGGNSKVIENFGNSIIELTDTSFVVLNSTGKTASSRQHGFTSPHISANDRYALLYDMNGTSYRIESVSKTIYSGTTDHQILDGDLSKSGVYAIITKDENYLSRLNVYSKRNKQLYEWQSAKNNIVSVTVSPDGKRTALVGFHCENGKFKSSVLLFEYDQEKPIAEFSFDDNMLISADFTSSSKITAVGDSATYIIDIKEKTYTEVDYDHKLLAGYDYDENYGTVLLLSKFNDRHNCNMIVLDENGKEISSIETELNPNFVLLKGNEIYCISNDYLYTYNNKGKAKNKIPIGTNISSCAVLGNNAYIMGTSKVDKVKL